MWYYQDKPFEQSMVGDNKAFVYVIIRDDGKAYYGKKRFSVYRRKKVRGKKNRKKITSSSDWETYWGSNQPLLDDVKALGEDKFKRYILRLCKTLSEASYYEAYYQFMSGALLYPTRHYNNWISVRINRKHLTNCMVQ